MIIAWRIGLQISMKYKMQTSGNIMMVEQLHAEGEFAWKRNGYTRETNLRKMWDVSRS